VSDTEAALRREIDRLTVEVEHLREVNTALCNRVRKEPSPKPLCMVCNQPVKTVIWDCGGRLEAYCHEAMDVVRLAPGQEWPTAMFVRATRDEDCAA
jgi:hypothetical protein